MRVLALVGMFNLAACIDEPRFELMGDQPVEGVEETTPAADDAGSSAPATGKPPKKPPPKPKDDDDD